jgi:hypothetical protein
MADGVNDDLCLCDLIENEVGIRNRDQAAHHRIIGADPNIGMEQEQVETACIRAWTRFAPNGQRCSQGWS